MDLEDTVLSETSQTEKVKYQMRYHQYAESEKLRQKQSHRYREQTGGCQRGELWRDE